MGNLKGSAKGSSTTSPAKDPPTSQDYSNSIRDLSPQMKEVYQRLLVAQELTKPVAFQRRAADGSKETRKGLIQNIGVMRAKETEELIGIVVILDDAPAESPVLLQQLENGDTFVNFDLKIDSRNN